MQALHRLDTRGDPARRASYPAQPPEPQIGLFYYNIGRVHLLQSHVDEAILWMEKARSANPQLHFIHAELASAYALKGDTEYAAAELTESHRLSGDDRYKSMARLRAAGYWGVPKVRALWEATYFAGLRKAGMPEE
jgi:tetratricopeptide (TPR) repeat protein